MSNFFTYVLEVSIIFKATTLFYRYFLSKLTFHQVNRFILLLLPILSMVLPIWDMGFFYGIDSSEIFIPDFEASFLYLEPSVETALNPNIGEKISPEDNLFLHGLLFVYVIGVATILVRTVSGHLAVFSIRKKAYKQKIGGVDVFLTTVATPFSYFKWIFIPENQSGNLHALVLEHECAHIKLKHTLDLIFADLYAIAFWLNPVIPLYRKSLKALHEFQADEAVLNQKVKPSDYLQLMLVTIQNKNNHPSFSYFNNSLIKKRIDMMTKSKSKKGFALYYLMLLPSAIFISIAFSNPMPTVEPTPNGAMASVEKVAIPPSMAPIENFKIAYLTSSFGQKTKQPKTGTIVVHQGIDIKVPKGTPVLATEDGIIAMANLKNDWGNLVVISHSDGYETWYAHLERFDVAENQVVQKGEVIGYVGSTGLSSGPHLHYEVHKDKKRLDPMKFIKE
ncbi:peptidoglycan DD-metalloendopeptidase family protein [Flavobacteriaceae bacterium TP-CH-4]|uniref:Peptidoglycan DD-metalloendopeptidase family protein n=1 Tax=Pelagihabitans pacificus TaxID=2696054 RepID=A0A967ASM6_9FLAO|nr:M23/M56 family metallopeptidase [Pelagihabitans pacificus]NHF58730.1 peptidoglycan DD-metalloendopeptidase family protein [Pelagihabitans pacificus]